MADVIMKHLPEYLRFVEFYIILGMIVAGIITVMFISIVKSPIYCNWCNRRFENDELDEYVDHLSECSERPEEISDGNVQGNTC